VRAPDETSGKSLEIRALRLVGPISFSLARVLLQPSRGPGTTPRLQAVQAASAARKFIGQADMMKLIHITLMVLAVIAVAVGDVFLKKAALAGGFTRAMTSPWMAAAIVLYLYQIIFFTYAFLTGWQLSVIGSMQTVLYALIILGAGVLYFNESLSLGQGIGVAMAFAGVMLMNMEA
jgi:drug/metabolite transporter (DMT)-like permease